MRTSEILLSIAAFIVIIAGMKAATVIVVPFILSAFIAIICAPPMFWLQRKGVPAVLATLLVVLLILAAGIIVAALVGQSVQDFSQDLPMYKAKIKARMQVAPVWLAQWGIDPGRLKLSEIFDPGAAMNLAAALLNGLGNVLANGFLILMTVIFMLLEAASFPRKLKAIMATSETRVSPWEHFLDDVKRYMAIKTGVSLITGGLAASWLAVLGIEYALLWGLLAFVLNYVPNIGSIIAAVPAVMLALVQFGPGHAAAVAAGYVAINLVMGNVIEPRFMGRGLGLSTLVVFLSLLFWGWVLGPVGMLLSVPLTITAKIALDSRSETRWLAIMLGSEKYRPAASPLESTPESNASLSDGPL